MFEALISCIALVISLGVSFYLANQGKKQLKEAHELTKSVSTLSKKILLFNLRHYYLTFSKPNKEVLAAYQEFVWRFETYNYFTLDLIKEKCAVPVKVLGYSIPVDKLDFDKDPQEYYLVEITEKPATYDGNGCKPKEFSVGVRLYCFFRSDNNEGRILLSLSPPDRTDHERYTVIPANPGQSKLQSVPDHAPPPDYYPRIKDYKPKA